MLGTQLHDLLLYLACFCGVLWESQDEDSIVTS